MPSIRFRSILLATALLLGTLAGNLAAGAAKVVTPESVGLSSERLERLAKAMQEDVDQKKTGGVVVLIARHGSIAYHKAFDMADVESGKKMQTDSLFRLYSMTKPVTSVALLTLFEEGKFQLNDPLGKYIPAFKNVKVFVKTDENGRTLLEEPKRKITIQDVFRHTAGFAYGFGDTPVDKCYQQAGIDFQKMDSLRELVDRMEPCPLLYQPGEKWVYSVAHDVQAYLVEYFSGMRFGKYVQSKIIQPLGMKDAEDLVVLYFTQFMGTDFGYRRFQTLVYQAIVD
jgi:CubicO group peptidase (beta-lactamase class C family)